MQLILANPFSGDFSPIYGNTPNPTRNLPFFLWAWGKEGDCQSTIPFVSDFNWMLHAIFIKPESVIPDLTEHTEKLLQSLGAGCLCSFTPRVLGT